MDARKLHAHYLSFMWAWEVQLRRELNSPLSVDFGIPWIALRTFKGKLPESV